MEPETMTFWLMRYIGHHPHQESSSRPMSRVRPTWTAHGYVDATSLGEAWQQVREWIRDGLQPAPTRESFYVLVDATHVVDEDTDDIDERYAAYRRIGLDQMLPVHTHEVTLRLKVESHDANPEKWEWQNLLPSSYMAEVVESRDLSEAA